MASWGDKLHTLKVKAVEKKGEIRGRMKQMKQDRDTERDQQL